MLFVNCLSILFIALIAYQIYFTVGQEGMETSGEYKDYGNDPMILAKQNAGNIQVLKEQITDIIGIKPQIQDLKTKVDSLQEQVSGIISAQKSYTPVTEDTKPPNLTGLDEDDE